MKPRRPLFPALAAVALAAGPIRAAPLTASYLSPSKFVTAVGETLTLRFEVGTAKDAQPAPWPTDEIAWFFIRGGPTQENRDEAKPQRAEDSFISVKIEHAGVTVIGIDRKPATREMTAGQLRDFCEHNTAGVDAQLKALAPHRKLRVQHIASAKTLIRAQDSSGRIELSGLATSKTGQKVEIRPQFDPTAASVGSDLAVVAYVDGAKRPAALVQATNVGAGTTTTFTTDAEGSGHFRVSAAGLWRVEFHWVQPPAGDSSEWTVWTATLTFEVPAKGAGQ